MQYTVTMLNNYIKNMFTMDAGLNNVYVKGEVSNCKYHTSGHIYFTIKDPGGQIACVMFAGQRTGLKFRLEEGMSVIVYGNVSIYERDGKYQLYAREITQDGKGILYQKYEELKKLLELKGYFEESHKKAIPKYAKKIGVVTARTGAALQDIINVSRRRNPWVQLYLSPAQVQGDMAAPSIVDAIKILKKKDVDVIIVGRGGGSIEDLWAFNEEIVAKAVYDCSIPIISAVGHETDTTIIDYVSDMRAPTPSAAAELAVFDYFNFEQMINDYKYLLTSLLNRKLQENKSRLENYTVRLGYCSPNYRLQQYKQNSMDYDNRLQQLITNKIKDTRQLLNKYIEKLNGVSPLSKLKSGYSLVTDSNKKIINSSKDVTIGENINISLIDGDIVAKIEEISYNSRNEDYYEDRREI